MFLPSGTMCNQIAILTHCRPGDEIIAHESATSSTNEGGGPAALAGAMSWPAGRARAVRPPPTVRAAFRAAQRNAPPQTLLEVEQTANIGGGSVWPLEQLNAVPDGAHDEAGHPHGRRAADERRGRQRRSARARWSAGCDSVWLDFTKGLGAPLGAVLCGSAAFIDEAWRWKQRLGGSHATGRHLRRGLPLCTGPQHRPARRRPCQRQALARGLAQIPGIAVEEPETNLVFFDPAGAGLAAPELIARLRLRGVHLSLLGGRIRACTHLDVTEAMIEEALGLIRRELAGA